MNEAIPNELMVKWSARIAKDLKKWIEEEYRHDLAWDISPGPCGAQYEPPNQVTQNIRIGFSFGAKFKGGPSGAQAPGNDIDKHSIRNISKRVIKKMKK